ncbi:MAG: anaerobic ribonucleoside-triphosphate reductase [Erysipelotrichaceae bacterium]|nr:anaerobic ribonucleoside-triphosphate reductase [Erysipelotrichaceae bacterium]MDY5728445.1 anaerobic ribonucleoside-triphosphate reductase [Erysipelotrichaceae bacterium]
MKVRKRNGNLQQFNSEKIVVAITSAMKSASYSDTDNIAEKIALEIEKELINNNVKVIEIEDLQDLVEGKLMSSELKDVARKYIRYRYDRERVRQSKSKLMSDISEKLNATNVENQNANLDEKSFSGRMNEANRVVMKDYALYNCMSEMARNNHLNNEIYIHDLDSYAVGMHNCLSIPFDKILKNGFKTRQTDVRSPRSVNTAMQLVAVVMQLQSLQQFGGVSATHLDWTMIPYVRYSFYKHFRDGMKYIENQQELPFTKEESCDISIDDERYKSHKAAYQFGIDMTSKEIYQAVEALYHNLNTLQSRSGQQLPFSSINYGTCTLTEGRMVTKALLDVSIDGLGTLHKTPIFPCGIFQCMKGVNRQPSDPNYDLFKLALKSTSLRLYPNYVNVDWSNNEGYDRNDPKTYMSTMGCRTSNGYDINGFGQLKDGRGNICPVTIIMPTLAMEATKDVDKFMLLLDLKIHEAKDMLLERFEWICSQPAESANFMYENGTMEGYVKEEGIRSALKHGTLAVGQLGLAETLQLLVSEDQCGEEGMKLAKRIEDLFKTRCNEFKNQYKLNFGVYYTPAENLCYTAMKKFKEKYGIIKNVSDKDFFTNSIHVPVYKQIDPFEKIDIESQLTGYSNAGCITYVELESTSKHNIEALEELVNYAMDRDIPYFAINIPNDTCLDCGYTDEFNDVCPMCGSEHIQQLRRVTGYLTGNYKTAFNKGKQQETEMRVKHNEIF